MRQTEILEKLQEQIRVEHLDVSLDKYQENDPRLIEAALEIAQSSKSILGGLYYDFRKPDSSKVRELKNKAIGKIANIVRNTLERPLLTQQKFNEQTYFLLKLLLLENQQLKQEIEELKKQDSKVQH